MMSELGLTYVRIGEFAWSRLEPDAGRLCFDWLDQSIATLSEAGLQLIIGTPTATPPKWLVDQYPDILPVSPETGLRRGFGSRRHCDFSSDNYVREALRISELVVKRYGGNSSVVGWQTDNELGSHETTFSASPAAGNAFQRWCSRRYQTIEALNRAWGTVFWSMEYRDFTEVDLPVGAVTEISPAHQLAYRRFSSDQMASFHNRLAALIRRHAPGKFITHNFIPMFETGADNFALAEPLDFASYDNYPLGRTDQQFSTAPAAGFRSYMRTGHPDLASYYHDQCRDLTDGGFWVMEQQPGPVNWAHNNPRPAPGMIRLWTLEALAHGALCVVYFRWRQAVFGQEQMHAGLLRQDDSKSDAWPEIVAAMEDARKLGVASSAPPSTQVAIITGSESQWVTDIEKQAGDYDFNEVQFSYYSALRQLGLNVDFVATTADFSRYELVFAPCLPIVDDTFVQRCEQSGATFVFGPRSGSKTAEFSVPEELPPGLLQRIMPVRILSVETLRADCEETLSWKGNDYRCGIWREEICCEGGEVLAHFHDKSPALVRFGHFLYLATLTDGEFLKDLFQSLCNQSGIATRMYGDDIRVCKRGDILYAFNYSGMPRPLPLTDNDKVLLGEKMISPYGVTAWVEVKNEGSID